MPAPNTAVGPSLPADPPEPNVTADASVRIRICRQRHLVAGLRFFQPARLVQFLALFGGLMGRHAAYGLSRWGW